MNQSESQFRKALSAKDMMWRVFFGVGGAIALMAALGDGGYFHTFAFDEGRHDSEFFTAWICGLALGLFAATFDWMVGATDHLRQRPVTPEQLFWHRQRTMGSVVLVWFLAAPMAGWVWMAITQRTLEFAPVGVLSAWASFVPAISAMAIGYFGASLPVRWWLRPIVVAGAFLAAFSLIHDVSQNGHGYQVRWLYVLLHLGTAAVFVAAARTSCAVAADADRVLPKAVRFTAVPLAVIAFGVVAGGLQREGAQELARELWREYPQLSVVDGAVALVDFDAGWRGGHPELCDRDHRRVKALPEEGLPHIGFPRPRVYLSSWIGFREPRWHNGVDSSWVAGGDSNRPIGYGVYLTHDGRAFATPSARWVLEPTGIGPDHELFSANSELSSMGVGSERIVAVDRATKDLYCYDREQRHFVPLPLPNGDRFVRINWRGISDEVFQVLQNPLLRAEGSYEQVRGENGSYLLQDGKWVVLPVEPASENRRERDLVEVGDGWLEATVTVPAKGDRAEFSHRYSPQTATELAYAGLAAGLALVTPPLLVVGFSWRLAIAALGLALILGGVAARRVRRLGGEPADRQLWLWLTVVLGPLGLLLSVVFERPRAYRERPRLAVAPTPRIFTGPISKEMAS